MNNNITPKVSGLCDLSIKFVGFGHDADKVKRCVILYTDSDHLLEQIQKVVLRVLDSIKGQLGTSDYESTKRIIAERFQSYVPKIVTLVAGDSNICKATNKAAEFTFQGFVKANQTQLEAPKILVHIVDRGCNLDLVVKKICLAVVKAIKANPRIINRVISKIPNSVLARVPNPITILALLA